MKKLAVAIALVLLVGAFAMAGEVVISGSATTSAGYNLDSQAYGLLSEVTSDVSITVGEADGTKQGDGAWYGVIDPSGASIAWGCGLGEEDDDIWYFADTWDEDNEALVGHPGFVAPFAVTAPDVTAKITNGNPYVQLQSEA